MIADHNRLLFATVHSISKLYIEDNPISRAKTINNRNVKLSRFVILLYSLIKCVFHVYCSFYTSLWVIYLLFVIIQPSDIRPRALPCNKK